MPMSSVAAAKDILFRRLPGRRHPYGRRCQQIRLHLIHLLLVEILALALRPRLPLGHSYLRNHLCWIRLLPTED